METINFLSSHGDLRLDASFKDVTTIKMGGPIKYLVSPFDVNRLKLIMTYLEEEKIPFKVIGRGSNLVCGKNPYEGCVIRLENLSHYYFEEDGRLYVEAGMSMMRLANIMANNGYSNLEFASGIPGSLGGLIFMNAGAYRMCMADIISEVLVLRDGKFEWLSKDELDLSYRHSIFHEHRDWTVVAARLFMKEGNKEEIKALMEDRLVRRRATQPLDKPSAGSCFKNPEGDFAWRLIDAVGLRGYNYHGVLVSEKHPNFIVNTNGAHGEEFIATINFVKAKVSAEFNIELKTEVEIFNC